MKKIVKTMDGNTAAAYVSYAFTDVAAIYPITPSSPMAETVDEWAAHGRKNIFGQEVKLLEMQSEAGAAGAMHGALQGGALTSTYTASQGLLLMIPNMYKMAGELLPGVFHVSARTLAAHALSIFGDHGDVMACRQTGFALLASSSVQEAMDLGAVAHLAAIKARIPFLHFFDGFRTSHEVQKIEAWDYADLESMLDKDAAAEFRNRALFPDDPKIRGTAQNPDIFFQAREAVQPFYDKLGEITLDYLKQVSEKTGRKYSAFDYVGSPSAKHVIVCMGSACETIEETMEDLENDGYGLVKVRLYRPFLKEEFLNALPKSAKTITVLDRTKEPGAPGDPLYLDVRDALAESSVKVLGGRYGLGSKDTTPAMILGVYKNMEISQPKNFFTLGIDDDVSGSSIAYDASYVTRTPGLINCKFWGLGSDGTVGANKTAIKIIGDETDMFAQGYFAYDSKKSGGVTISHLRFGANPIKSTYLVQSADYVACHNQSYLRQYDMLKELKDEGTFLLNTKYSEEELAEKLPAKVKRQLAEKKAKFYIIDGLKIAREIGLENRINMIMQAAFFKLNPNILPTSEAVKHLKDGIDKAYGKKGQKILDMNYRAVDAGLENITEVKIPSSWKNAKDDLPAGAGEKERKLPQFIEEVLVPMNEQVGDDIPASRFVGREDGTFPHGTAAYEKRGVASSVPEWIKENCIQCNQCSFVCPHATIRPTLLDASEKDRAPNAFETIPAIGKEFSGLEYRIQISPFDCLGCGNCADICPAKTKALKMVPFDEFTRERENWDFAMTVGTKQDLTSVTTVKGSQFAKPYLEFSGACAGCGETPYMKLLTQLYGDRMVIANATGCSSIWGGSAPSMPYCKDENGRGPAWGNSLFEDNAEYGLGMLAADKQEKAKLREISQEVSGSDAFSSEIKNAAKKWLEDGENDEAYIAAIANEKPKTEEAEKILAALAERKGFLRRKVFWAIGGDGWAYDIGYGGLDHVLASGENINVLVYDTEVYSNTGGQASKATPAAAIAKFAASGKRIKKKDLGAMAMTYGYVYVAQVGMGADKNHLMKTITEAVSYDGPSLIICYAPCINHGLRKGMGKSQENTKDAVASGYWHLYRFDPRRKAAGENPFVLDSKEPTASFQDFIKDQARYSSLEKEFPDIAGELFAEAEKNARERYEGYRKLAEKGV